MEGVWRSNDAVCHTFLLIMTAGLGYGTFGRGGGTYVVYYAGLSWRVIGALIGVAVVFTTGV